MGILASQSPYKTLNVRFDDAICFIQISRPESNNAINDELIQEFGDVLVRCEYDTKIVVVEGLPDVFCFGADFQSIHQSFKANGAAIPSDPEPLYDLWLKLATGPYISVAHVRGQANAGGIGFVAACDVVIADVGSVFSLSELLFGLMPACVLPFLIQKMGFSKAHYMTLTTEAISAKTALDWGLVDELGENTETLLRKKLLRLRRLSKKGICRYKDYISSIRQELRDSKAHALNANTAVFSDTDTIKKVSRYVETAVFPWE